MDTQTAMPTMSSLPSDLSSSTIGRIPTMFFAFSAGLIRENCGVIGLSEITPRAWSAAMINVPAVMAMTRPAMAMKPR